jgi:NDMA-dependent alcohol dehydrogenase
MKARGAVLFASPGKWEVCDIELDPPHEGEVLVRMVASGLCHSDAHYTSGDQPPSALPLCGGHEGAGVIEAVGPSVSDLEPGDHVVLAFIPACGRCAMCGTGHQNLCDLGAKLQSGPQFDGTYRMHHEGQDVSQFLHISTFANWSVVSQHNCVKVPKDLPLETLCLLGCGVGTGWGSMVHAGEAQPGDTVLVMGVGGIGINAIQGARHVGASTIVAVDPVAFKRETAISLGATHTFEDMPAATEFVRSVTNGQGARVAVVTTDVLTGEYVAAAFKALAKAGTVVVTSIAALDHSTGIPVNLLELVAYQKRIQGALFGASNPTIDIPRQVRMYQTGQLKLDELITHRYRLDDINQGYDDLFAGRNIRGVVVHEH